MTYAATSRSGRVVGSGLVLLVSAGTHGRSPDRRTGGRGNRSRGAGHAERPQPRQGDGTGVPVAQRPGVRGTDPRLGPGPARRRRHRPAVQRADARRARTLLWGDWNRDGAYTPAVFTNGHWVIYDAMVGSAPVPSREFDFGMAGDKPVVGDFNRDGRTDVGVVRRGVWLLRGFPSAGSTWRRFAFGRPTDTPVTGDWNGDGRDGVGVRRGTRWFLLQNPAALKKGAAPTYTFAFGKNTDRAVVGDWNGDAKDTVGDGALGHLVPAGPAVPHAHERHDRQAAPGRGALHGDPPRGAQAAGTRHGGRAVDDAGRPDRCRLRHRVGRRGQPQPGVAAGPPQPPARQGAALRPGQPGGGE